MTPARAVRLYRAALWLLPRGFRHRFGAELVEVFGDRCRDAVLTRSRGGARGELAHALADLVRTAAAERHVGLAIVAALIGGFAGLVDLDSQEVQASVLVVGAGAFALAAVRPACAWRSALLVGIAIPVTHLVARAAGAAPPWATSTTPLEACLALIPAGLGAMFGLGVRGLLGSGA